MLTVNEIRGRAHAFVKEWQSETREAAERQTFWNEWFQIFGIHRRRFVTFEHYVKTYIGPGFADGFWPGRILIEHKSAEEDLDKAMGQAVDYLDGISEGDMPKYVVLSDFRRFRVRDLDTGKDEEFPLEELPGRIEQFMFLAGYRERRFREEQPVDVSAAQLMGRVHDALAESGYSGHELRVLLVRLLFVLFADDTGVWETGLFEDFLENRTAEDGRDLGGQLQTLFEVLNQEESKRQATLDADLRAFPYINGRLFEERLPVAAFSKDVRDLLVEAARFNWSAISPAIFGSMFQSVMNPEERHALGGHYTTEENILKVIEPLFLDELREELSDCAMDRRKLAAFRDKLARSRFFDPACGCGNFLIIAYRELRRLELDVLRRLRELDQRVATGQLVTNVAGLSQVDVDQFHGIEIEEFPARIAEVAMYLMDHLCNQELSQAFGTYYARFPLRTAARIEVGNALQLDWDTVFPADDCSYVLGNPPFVAKKARSAAQRADIDRVFHGRDGTGVLDYVTAWFQLAAEYVKGRTTRVAFVATNSITQGEQVPALWPPLLEDGLEIDFAHRTFRWTSEAPRRASVHVVVVGFSDGGQRSTKLLYEYEKPTSDPLERTVAQINPYLADAPADVIPTKRREPLVDVPPLRFGSMPNDGGHLIVSPEQRQEIMDADPIAAKYLRRLQGARQLLHDEERWCLWLTHADAGDLRNSDVLRSRIRAVKEYREASSRATTKKLAERPTVFGEIRQPTGRYLCLPRHPSENRDYIPAVFETPDVVAHDSTATIEGASDFAFGILSSSTWAIWVKTIGGRLKSDLRISSELVYNNFPWPIDARASARARVSAAAAQVLAARHGRADNSLAELYDPLAMPTDLRDAHNELDRCVDSLFGRGAFDNAKRMAALLKRHQELAAPLGASGRSRSR